MGDYGSAHGGSSINHSGFISVKIKKSIKSKKGSDDQVISDWVFRIISPLECRLVGAARKRIRPYQSHW